MLALFLLQVKGATSAVRIKPINTRLERRFVNFVVGISEFAILTSTVTGFLYPILSLIDIYVGSYPGLRLDFAVFQHRTEGYV
jgi:hypothetical protein